MKRILALFMIVAVLLCTAGCKQYKPVKSTKLEKTKIATMQYEKEKYEANYELFRMLFLSAKETVSGNDPQKFEGENGAALLEEARVFALDRLYEIYSVFALCDALDINLYSRKVNKAVEESITVSIEGGFGADDQQILGLGSYEAYLANLKAFYYMNYAVQDLMLRYSYGISAINTYYYGTVDDYGNKSEEGALTYTDSQVTDFYNSADTRRVLLVFTQLGEEEAIKIRENMASKRTEQEVSDYMLKNTAADPEDAIAGLVIGKYSIDNSAYASITEAAFALAEGETSAPIVGLNAAGIKGHYILYCAKKSEAHLTENRALVTESYLDNEIGKKFDEVKKALAASVSFTDFYNGLTLASIRMDEE